MFFLFPMFFPTMGTKLMCKIQVAEQKINPPYYTRNLRPIFSQACWYGMSSICWRHYSSILLRKAWCDWSKQHLGFREIAKKIDRGSVFLWQFWKALEDEFIGTYHFLRKMEVLYIQFIFVTGGSNWPIFWRERNIYIYIYNKNHVAAWSFLGVECVLPIFSTDQVKMSHNLLHFGQMLMPPVWLK